MEPNQLSMSSLFGGLFNHFNINVASFVAKKDNAFLAQTNGPE